MSDVREFQPVSTAQEASNLLREAVRTVASAMIWTKEQKHVLSSNIRSLDEAQKTFYAWIPTGTDPEWFREELNKIGSRDCFFSVSLSKANIFFRATLIGHDDNGFLFKAPDKLFKVQRRKDMRLMIPFGHVIRVEMPDPLFPDQKISKKIFDISAGGLSFIVTEQESAAFHQGLQLNGVTFSIRSRKINVEGEVRHIRSQPAGSGTPGVKVGFQFSRIDAGDAQWIAAYVFEESRKYLSKYL